MPLSSGCNHVTVISRDIDRLVGFYEKVFEAEVVADLTEDGLRHALIDLGAGFCLHPFEFAKGSEHGQARPEMFDRGHIDHLAINMADGAAFETARRRLVEAGATAGRVRDFGAVAVLTFRDPDGMDAEIALWKDGPTLSMAESRVEEYAG